MSKRFSRAIVLVVVLSLASGAWANLIGHWTFDNPANLGADQSGTGNDGTVQGNAAFSSDARIGGGSLLLDGSDDYIRVGLGKNNMLADWTKNLSIAAWAKPQSLSRQWNCFFGHTTQNNGVKFEFMTTNFRFTTLGVMDYDLPVTAKAGEWSHVAVTFNDAGNLAVFYLNGAEAGRVAGGSPATRATGNYNIGYGGYWEPEQFQGLLDDVRIYNHALTPKEVQDAMKGAGPELAGDPDPKDKATDVPADAVLAWKAGKVAGSHDVYLGTSFNDVNNAGRAQPAGVLASQGQTDAQYDPDGLLTYGQIYYWRIDEVNAAPDNTIFKGGIWSFTVESYAYPIMGVTATASSAAAGMGPEKTIDGSGLTGDLHGTEGTTMWLTGGAKPNWIQYQFDKVYKLNDLKVWNSNQLIEGFLGFGAKDVTIETSADGTTWTALANVPEFARATGLPGYAANTTVNLGGVMAQYVKLTINSNWGGMAPQTGLSEVRFSYVPVQARAPQPATAATGIAVDPTLNWRPGREAGSHQVFFGTDPNAVANGTATAQTVTDHAFTPGSLNYGTTYYWKVDEVNTVTYPGDVWSFTTAAYGVVDDFESYSDTDNRIYDTWIDGLTDGKSGSQVGYDAAPFAETTIVHGGTESMPLKYDNTAKFSFSEAVRTFDPAQDWTASGVKSLSLWFRGVTGNGGQLYVKINSTRVLYDGDAADLTQAMWQVWNIDLSKADKVNSVRSLTIGIEGAGVKGTLYIDDIRLYPKAPELIVPIQPNQTNLVARYTFDGNLKDSVGSHHGTAFGDAKVTTDAARGQVLAVDGNGDGVDVPYSADLNPPAFTVSLWANPSSGGSGYRSPLTARDDTPQRGYILYVEPGNTWQFWTGTGTGWDNAAGPAAQLDEWAHVTATLANDQKMLYLNGRLVAQSTAALSLNTQRPLRIGAGATESTAGNYFFRGLIDEVCLYNRALPAEEVAGLAGRTQPLHKPF
ncbi:MAG: discoidin domain-containing protein [Phycisphaerae bacterium]|nr:discoidin domain-containing protein [Phycisphaerae bacterium]